MHRGFNKGSVSVRSFPSVKIETGREKKENGRKVTVLERGEKWEHTEVEGENGARQARGSHGSPQASAGP